MVLSVSSVSVALTGLPCLAPRQLEGIRDMANGKSGDDRILIVGGSSGMGLALAKRCLAAGSHVIIAGRSKAKLGRVRETPGKPASLNTAVIDIVDVSQV